jgi:hypothetical protein
MLVTALVVGCAEFPDAEDGSDGGPRDSGQSDGRLPGPDVAASDAAADDGWAAEASVSDTDVGAGGQPSDGGHVEPDAVADVGRATDGATAPDAGRRRPDSGAAEPDAEADAAPERALDAAGPRDAAPAETDPDALGPDPGPSRCPPPVEVAGWALLRRSDLLWVGTSDGVEAWTVGGGLPLDPENRRVAVQTPEPAEVTLLADGLSAIVRSTGDDARVYEVDGLRGVLLEHDGQAGMPVDNIPDQPPVGLAVTGPRLYVLHGASPGARLSRIDYEAGPELDPALGVRADLGGLSDSVEVGDATVITATWRGRVVLATATGGLRELEPGAAPIADAEVAVDWMAPYGDADAVVLRSGDRVGVLDLAARPHLDWLPIEVPAGGAIHGASAPDADAPVSVLQSDADGVWSLVMAAPDDEVFDRVVLERPADGFPNGESIRLVVGETGAWVAAGAVGDRAVFVWRLSGGVPGALWGRIDLEGGAVLSALSARAGHHRGRCDDRDDTCAGDVTDGHFGSGAACRGGPGVCDTPGMMECEGPFASRCDTAPGGSRSEAGAERCDGADNDCDGVVDEAQPARRSVLALPDARPALPVVAAAPDEDAFYVGYTALSGGLLCPHVVRVDADGPGVATVVPGCARHVESLAVASDGRRLGVAWFERSYRRSYRDAEQRLVLNRRLRILGPDLAPADVDAWDQTSEHDDPSSIALAAGAGYWALTWTHRDWLGLHVFDATARSLRDQSFHFRDEVRLFGIDAPASAIVSGGAAWGYAAKRLFEGSYVGTLRARLGDMVGDIEQATGDGAWPSHVRASGAALAIYGFVDHGDREGGAYRTMRSAWSPTAPGAEHVARGSIDRPLAPDRYRLAAAFGG